MSIGRFGNSSGLSLEQLIALNDEMSALVRAGVPLDRGLVDISEEMPGRIGKLAAQIGQRLRRGESLAQILASDEQVFPPVWRAVVEAGLRSGRLTAALEGLSTTARRVAELRRAVLVAWIYPLTVMALAYGLFVFVVTTLSPVMLYALEDLTGRSNPILAAIVRLGESAAWWALPVPVAGDRGDCRQLVSLGSGHAVAVFHSVSLPAEDVGPALADRGPRLA